jgi:hypothetical protein
MAKGRIYVKLDSPEIKKLLKGPEVKDFLLDLGNDVASKAGPEYKAIADTTSRKSRVVVNVIDPRPKAKYTEMKYGKLARALGEVSR